MSKKNYGLPRVADGNIGHWKQAMKKVARS